MHVVSVFGLVEKKKRKMCDVDVDVRVSCDYFIIHEQTIK